MFWIGLLISSISFLLQVGFSRNVIKNKYPKLSSYQIDYILIGLFCFGVVLTILDNQNLEKQLNEIENQVNRIESFEIKIQMRYSAIWSKGKPPEANTIGINQTKPYGFLILETKPYGLKKLNLYPSTDINVIPLNQNTAEIKLNLSAQSGDWIHKISFDDLKAVKVIEFFPWGINSDIEYKYVSIKNVKISYLVNGKEMKEIVEVVDKTFDVPKKLKNFRIEKNHKFYSE